MFRNRSASVHQFAMVPRAAVPRSSFSIQKTHKTTFDSGYLVPVYVNQVLPGDTFNVTMTALCRLATPIFPLMDNMYLESFFFFVPDRLLWTNFQRFMGEQTNPGDSIDYLIPQQVCPPGGYLPLSLQDYMGLPTVGQVAAAATVSHNALPLRAYNLCIREWFRDENLQDSPVVDLDDGPDDPADYVLVRRGKRHDYFTSCLPWPQKGDPVMLPLGESAPIKIENPSGSPLDDQYYRPVRVSGGAHEHHYSATPSGANTAFPTASGPSLFADLSEATSQTINALRSAITIQQLLERDARGGTRYTEITRSHFGVISPDARLQRPEYIGGGSTPVNISPIAQTQATSVGVTPQGNLAAMGNVIARGHRFGQSFTEHGWIIGMVSVRADLTYQQGLRRMWSEKTRYDRYWPSFANLGEQAVLSKEIFCDGTAADEDVFGYQEAWGHLRYDPSQITGLFRSTTTGTLDAWHLSQNFATRPVLNDAFIQDSPPIQRVVAVGSEALGQEFIGDFFFDARVVRPLPMYSVPGLGVRF